MFTLSDDFYTMDSVDTFISQVGDFDFVKFGKVQYANVPCAFDIEASSFLQSGEKCALMYIWQFGLNGRVIIGRTWQEFRMLLYLLAEEFGFDETHILPVFVHNLSYEFQFMRREIKWKSVFSTDLRKPLYALTESGYEFRCSYRLSGYSLENLGKNLLTYHVGKKTGDLDYSLIRTPLTPMTRQELMYCVYDVLVVMAFIKEETEREGDVTKLPLTKTGYVRNFCRQFCFGSYEKNPKKRKLIKMKYQKAVRNLTLDANLYQSLRSAFQGGFTHCNPRYSGRLVEHVHSVDFTSSYPYVMTTCKFPMGPGIPADITTVDDFERYAKLGCVMSKVWFKNIRPKVWEENYISKSKCDYIKGASDKLPPVINNGRVVTADELSTTITELDWEIIKRYYEWDDVLFADAYTFEKDYLPRDFILSVLELYRRKTTLKDVVGEEVNYMLSKGMLNSTFGMAVQNAINELYEYCAEQFGAEWVHNLPNIDKELEKYNKSKKRFLFYAWGVWITAYARYNLMMSILEFGDDYVYSDTDSIKFKNVDKHIGFVKDYNKMVMRRIRQASEDLSIPIEMFSPANQKGSKKPLGIWTWETENDEYRYFKSLGAKRYLIQHESGSCEMTVAGVSKRGGIAYMKQFGDKMFDKFNQDLVIPPGYSGRIIPTYIDNPMTVDVVDYMGVRWTGVVQSGIHMEEGSYTFSISAEYLMYMAGFEEMGKV